MTGVAAAQTLLASEGKATQSSADYKQDMTSQTQIVHKTLRSALYQIAADYQLNAVRSC